MTNLQLSERLCVRHSQTATVLCLNKQCKEVACCPECVKSYHPHPKMLVDFKEFARTLPKSISGKSVNIVESTVPKVHQQKEQFEREQTALMETLKEMLGQQRKTVLSELDKLEASATKQYYGKEDVVMNISNYDYFVLMAASEALEVKMALANEQGITDLRNRMIQLHNISEREYDAIKEIRKSKESTFRKMRGLVEGGLAERLKKAMAVQGKASGSDLKCERKKSLEPERLQAMTFSRKASTDSLASKSPRKIISCKRL